MEMQRPPLRTLSFFEAAARCGSFRIAAQELHITTSAVSHQIRKLETFVGKPLFVRHGRGVKLTIEGAAYFEAIRAAYERIDEGTNKVCHNSSRETLTIRCGVSFGLRWLLPRIQLFISQYPDIDLQIYTPTAFHDASIPPIDVEIRYGPVIETGLCVEPLLEETILPLCSPALIKNRNILREPKDLSAFRLIDSEVSVVNWAQFISANRIPISNYSTLKFDSILLGLQAAVSGLGIALEGDFLAGEDLAAGRVIVPPALRQLAIRRSLRSFVVQEPNSGVDKIMVFRDWLFKMLSVSDVSAYGSK
jgi:LysR family glycine cleavage system transcriptional activator